MNSTVYLVRFFRVWGRLGSDMIDEEKVTHIYVHYTAHWSTLEWLYKQNSPNLMKRIYNVTTIYLIAVI